MRTSFLAVEFLLIFCVLPLAASIPALRLPHLGTLVAVAAACAVALRLDRTFDRRRLWNWAGFRGVGDLVGRRAFAALVAITAAVGLLWPDRLLDMPRTAPATWLVVLVAYPFVSAYPQELVFRAFLLHRYRPIFGDGRLAVAASAIAFSYMHVVYMNWPALIFTLPAGALLAMTYRRSGSLAAATVEHAAYGLIVFTFGLGRFFWGGRL